MISCRSTFVGPAFQAAAGLPPGSYLRWRYDSLVELKPDENEAASFERMVRAYATHRERLQREKRDVEIIKY
jgi:hypothetical protein